MVLWRRGRRRNSVKLHRGVNVNLGIQNLPNVIQQGILTPSTKGRLEELEASKDGLEIKIAIENMVRPKLSAEFITF